ncbi:MAG: PH domain-containing protein [Saprospiraceae bacterium]|nr:PH domain-containing protein [Saprospiraceae bacterium]
MEFRNESIDLDLLPAMEEVEWVPLEKNYRKIMYINTLFLWVLPIGWLVLSVIMNWWQYPVWTGLAMGITLLIPVLSTILVNPSFLVKSYAIRTHDILFQTGLISRSQTIMPFDRVQHCEINRGVLSRWLGLSELNIFTAGGSASDLSIPGLSEERAAELCQFILLKIDATDEEE